MYQYFFLIAYDMTISQSPNLTFSPAEANCGFMLRTETNDN